jgi:hypothetical protein
MSNPYVLPNRVSLSHPGPFCRPLVAADVFKSFLFLQFSSRTTQAASSTHLYYYSSSYYAYYMIKPIVDRKLSKKEIRHIARDSIVVPSAERIVLQ